jgi:2-phospho-L-lactate/phosphoenolpyruvate guanylyltransferase
MAAKVVRAAAPWPVAVVCADGSGVASFAQDLGARVIADPGMGLNAAVAHGVSVLKRGGMERVVITHADLPLVGSIPALLHGVPADHVALVPDRHHDGTNLLMISTEANFQFAYGKASFRLHRQEAFRLRLPFMVIEDERFALDIDTPADYERWLSLNSI